jgi:tetratricopeptide (TPR) repeat protein
VAYGLGFLQIPAYPKNSSPEPSKSQGSDLLQPAEALLEKGQYADAENQLQALVKTQRNNPQAWFDLGFAQSHLGKTSESVAAYRQAVTLSPKWFEAHLNLGLALAKSGNLAEAATSLRAATQLQPVNGGQRALSRAWLSLAQVLEETQGSPQETLAAYQKAAELNPENSDAVLGAARLMETSGDLPGAEKNYLSAAQMGNNDALQPLIRLYLKQKRFQEAETRLREYQAKNPTPEVLVLLSQVLKEEGKLPEAIATLEPVAGSNAASPQIQQEMAGLYLENKQYADATRILQRLLARAPNDAQLHWSLGTALLHQFKYPEAEAEMLQAVKLNQALDVDYWELAYAAQQNKHYELAIRALDLRAKRQPETAATYWIRAVSYDGLRLFKPAAENYKLFLEADAGKSPDDEFKARHRLKAIQH